MFSQILSTHSSKKYSEISLENFYVDIGADRGLISYPGLSMTEELLIFAH